MKKASAVLLSEDFCLGFLARVPFGTRGLGFLCRKGTRYEVSLAHREHAGPGRPEASFRQRADKDRFSQPEGPYRVPGGTACPA